MDKYVVFVEHKRMGIDYYTAKDMNEVAKKFDDSWNQFPKDTKLSEIKINIFKKIELD